jgi:hypothetical protein
MAERLIDANEFRRFCHEQLDKDKYSVDEILDMIDSQRTAYDVDAVVEQLEEKENNPHYFPINDGMFARGESAAYGTAIKIVKNMGEWCI